MIKIELPQEIVNILEKFPNSFLSGSSVEYHLGLTINKNDDYDIIILGNENVYFFIYNDLIKDGYSFIKKTNFGGYRFSKNNLSIDIYNLTIDKLFNILNHKNNQYIYNHHTNEIINLNLVKL